MVRFLGLRLLALLCFATTGCGIVGLRGDVHVRIENASTVTFRIATLYTSDGEQTFRDVAPGDATPYVVVSLAYRIATSEVVVDQDTLRLQVIDFVGEDPLDPGHYTYVLSVLDADTSHPSLTQQLRKDP